MNPTTYPTSPKNLPTDFLKLPKSYQSRVLIVLLALILFVLLYFAFIAGAAFLLYLSVIYPMESVGFYPLLIKLGAIVASGMLLIFTLKFAFKKMRYDRPTSVELKEKEHPSLFAFIRKLCEETGAPFPKKIIVNEEINAAVFYDKPLLSMFLPIRKNLLIGLGLVNALNLTEFKAVLAHEFGHFSQRSMKLGSYVYMANRIIHDMVYSRDKWDDMLDQWARADIRVAVFAWILKGIIWIVRGGLTLVYKGINLVHASLSREMEFNADLVAVSVTGSNAIINALAKIIGASNAMNLTYSQIMTAAEHNLYTKDLFYHQVKAEAHLNTTSKPQETTWEKDGITYIFDQEETMIPSMYASHPPNYDREQNAKRTFIEGIEDQQSAWTLFDNDEALKQLITSKIYEQSALNPKNEPLQEAAIVDDFIQGEIQETTYHERYCGTYDARYLHIMPLEEAKTKVSEHFASKEA
ncbi:MAG: M48 family metallopeptidase, partial [Bacteroidota bacterium]